MWMAAGSMLGLASKSKSRSDFWRGEASRLDAALGASAGPVVPLGDQQLREEAAVGHLLAGCRSGDVGKLGPDRGQPQHAAGTVDGGVGGLLGQAPVALSGHGTSPLGRSVAGRCRSSAS